MDREDGGKVRIRSSNEAAHPAGTFPLDNWDALGAGGAANGLVEAPMERNVGRKIAFVQSGLVCQRNDWRFLLV